MFRSLSETLKPGVDAALPILQSASKEALKIASPVVSDASKQAKEALQSVGVDPSPVLTAAQVVSLFSSSSSSSLHSRLNVRHFLIAKYKMSIDTFFLSLLLLVSGVRLVLILGP